MNILKFALLGAAVAYGINHITQKRENGTSILDDLLDNAPDFMEKAKQYATQTVDRVTENINNRRDNL